MEEKERTLLAGGLSRAKDWKVEFYHAPPFGKLDVIKRIADLNATAYIGDSIDDIRVFENVKLAFAPADAVDEVKKHADYILMRKGGEGCLLETFLSLRCRNEIWENYR